MRIVIAPDSFKGTLSAPEAARAIASAIRIAAPKAVIDLCPLADGGEGTAEILALARGGRMQDCEAHDPLGRPLNGRIAMFDDESCAIDLAEVSGLARLAAADRRPEAASTWGTGEMIRCAQRHGARRIVLGVGGSATIDGGIGIAAALGCRFLDQSGATLDPIAANLGQIRRAVAPETKSCDEIVLLTDVRNPLLGESGAARVFGPQKGASAESIERLEAGLGSLAEVLGLHQSVPGCAAPGFGAGGGVPLSLVALLGARIAAGAPYICEATDFAQRVAGADLLIVGEGSLDAQSLEGKVPLHATSVAYALGVPVVAVAGRVALDPNELRERGVRDVESCLGSRAEIPSTSELATRLLQSASERLMRRFLGGAL